MAETKKYLHNLDVENNKVMNLLLNPLTTAQRTTIGGTLGLSDEGYVCYDTDLDQQYFWDGTQWITVGGGGSVGPGVPTQIAFFDTTSSITSDTNLYWDNVNKRLAIGSNTPAYGLDVNKDVGIRGFTTTGGGQLGSELLTASGWTSTDWTGSFAGGWTHTPGNTTSLLNSLAAVVNSYYVVNCIISGDTSFGDNYITFGGMTSQVLSGDGTYNFYLKATSVASLVFLPDLFFDGTIILSVKLITPAISSNVIFKNSSNVTTNELRISEQAANVFLGTNAGARHVFGTGNVFLGNNTGQNDLSGFDNVFIGSFTGTSNATGTQQVFIGSGAGNSMTIGNGTVIIGAYAGRFYGTGITPLKSAINSIYLGSNTRASADGNTNEIVIGSDSGYILGLGSNTTRIGASNTILTYLAGRLLTGSTLDDLAYQLQLTNAQYFARFTTSAGTNTNAITFAKSTSSAIALHGSSAERKILIGDGGTGYANFTTYNSNVIQFTYSTALGGTTLPTSLTWFTPNFIYSTGTNAHTIVDVQPVINITGGTNTLRGFYYRPTVVSGSASPNTHVAFENTLGDIIHGNLSGSGTRMVTADSTGKLSTQAIPSSGSGLKSGTASGTNTYTVTISGVASYADQDAYLIRFTNGNTTSCTLNINSLGAINLYRNNDGALIGGDIVDGAEMLCVYNSTLSAFQCIGVAPNTIIGYVTNGESISITKGQPVYAFSGTGDRMVVKLAYNTSDSTSAQTVGLVMSSSIGANQKGLIMMQGLLDGLSTLPTSTWADGNAVYLGSTAGSITPTKQYAPNHLVYLGFVTTASPGAAGRMYVRVQNGYELDELHNVQAQSPTVNDVLYYFGGSPGQWKTASISTVLGYTPFNLPSLTSGSVLFSDGTTIAQDNANFFWDDTNNRLGIGQNVPTSRLHLNFNQNSVTQSDANGILLANSTAAIAGTQSISPAIVWQGNGWKTTATAASQDVRFRAYVLPVQGSTIPRGSWSLESSINGGAYQGVLSIGSDGIVSFFNNIAATLTVGSTATVGQHLNVGSTTGNYKSTNASILTNAMMSINTGQSLVSGSKAIQFDNINQLMFTAANSSNVLIARAGIDITNLTNTAGSESGDLIFSTQSGGTAISEKMRIFGGGNVGIGTSTDAGYKLDVNGTGRYSGSVTITSAGSLTLQGATFNGTRFTIGNQSTYNNGATSNTPLQIVTGNGAGAGVLGYAFDASNLLGLLLTAGNGTLHKARASINITNLNNTVGSESGDLAFSTASAGAAVSEKMRITGAGFVGINSTTPANTLDVIRGSAGTMGRGVYETASFSYNGDMKFGLYTASSNSTHGAGLSFGQTNLVITANSYYPGFDHQYVYGSTPAANAMRYNYTERNSGGTVVNYAANLMQVYGDGKIVFSPVASGVSTTVKMLLNTSTDDAVNTLQVNGSVKSTQFRLSALNTAPASAADTGTTGEIRIVNGFIYVCVATNTWQRVAIATW